MTSSSSESDSEEVPQDGGATQTSVALSISAIGPYYHRWDVEGMKKIFGEGLEPKGQGEPV